MLRISAGRWKAGLASAIASMWSLSGGVAASPTVVEIKPQAAGSLVPIVQVTLNDDGTTVVQNSTQSGAPFKKGKPVILESIVVSDGGKNITLQYFNEITNVILRGFNQPSVTGGEGVGVVYANGSVVKLGASASSKEAYRKALRDANETQDLMTYSFYDSIKDKTNTMPAAGVPDYDLIFGKGLEERDYLLVSERFGNTHFVVTPLDANGDVIAGANLLRFGYPTGAAYAMYNWNTGYTNTHYQNDQAQAFSVTKVSKFFDGTAVPADKRVVYGFRVDNDGEADVKFFGLAPEPFENNTILPAGIGNYIWVDANSNGLQDADETGLNGVTLELLDGAGNPYLNSFGEPTVTVSVDDNTGKPGYYAFAALPAGSYRVRVTVPTGFSLTAANGDSIGVDGPLNSDFSTATLTTDVIILDPGEINFAIDGGLVPVIPPGSIGDYVWEDTNGNGIQDSGEFGIGGVNVTLFDSSGHLVGSTTTDVDGGYLFENLEPDSYTVAFALPSGYTYSPTGAGDESTDSDAHNITGRTGSIVLAGGQDIVNVDAGLVPPPPLGSIGDLVWIDANGNGVHDAGEVGASGVAVTLYDSAGAPVSMVFTNAAGNYLFENLSAGDYRVGFATPAGTRLTHPKAGEDDEDSDADRSSGLTAVFSLGAGQHLTSIDAGLVPLSAIGDFIWLDTDRDGVQDLSEGGAADVRVNLLDGTTGSVIATTSTNSSGAYLFSSLEAGNYVVEIERPADYLFTTRTATTSADLDSDVDTTTGRTGLISLAIGQSLLAIDAGLIPVPVPGITLSKTGVYIPATTTPSTTSTIFGTAHNFGALIFGNLDASNGDTCSRLVVQGNATISGGYAVGHVVKGHPIPIAHGDTIDRLIVGGDLHDGTFGVNGNIVVGNTRFGPERNFLNGNVLRFINPITFDSNGNVPMDGSGRSFASLLTDLTWMSDAMGALVDRGVVSKNTSLPYEAVFVGDDTSFNVFNVTADEWSRTGSEIRITAPAGSTVLINIHGDEVDLRNVGMRLEGVDLERVLFNYVGTTKIQSFNVAHLGSVLAPRAAAVFVSGSIDGRAVLGGDVQTTNGFEFHNYYFMGQVIFPGTVVPPAIAYSFAVTNSGEVPLEDIRIDDALVAVLGGPIALAPGESNSTAFTAIYTLTETDLLAGSVSNTARVMGFTTDRFVVEDSDTFVLTLPAGTAPGSGGGSGGSGPGAGSGSRTGVGSGGRSVTAPLIRERGAVIATGIDLRSGLTALPLISVDGGSKKSTTSEKSVIQGKVANAAILEVLSGNARFLRIDPDNLRWKLRTNRLREGRNVVKLRAHGIGGRTKSVRIVIDRK